MHSLVKDTAQGSFQPECQSLCPQRELWMRSSIATLQEWLCPAWSRCRTARLAEDFVELFATSCGWYSHLTSNHNFPWFNRVLLQAPWVMTWTWAVGVPAFHYLCRGRCGSSACSLSLCLGSLPYVRWTAVLPLGIHKRLRLPVLSKPAGCWEILWSGLATEVAMEVSDETHLTHLTMFKRFDVKIVCCCVSDLASLSLSSWNCGSTDPESVKWIEAVPATNTGSSRSASSDQTIIWWVGDPKAAKSSDPFIEIWYGKMKYKAV